MDNVPSALTIKPTMPPLLMMVGTVALVPTTTGVVPLTVSFDVNIGVFPPVLGKVVVTSLTAWMVGLMTIGCVAVLQTTGVCVGK
jgi:hypothetical protein